MQFEIAPAPEYGIFEDNWLLSRLRHYQLTAHSAVIGHATVINLPLRSLAYNELSMLAINTALLMLSDLSADYVRELWYWPSTRRSHG